MKIGIVAPSSVVSGVELALGAADLEKAGFSVRVHPQCRKRFRFFAGTDEERASAFFEYACDPSLDVLFCARGGYGSMRLLPLLERKVRERGVPSRRLLVGSSDATALLEYVRVRWGWSTLYSPMPGLRTFLGMSPAERSSLLAWTKGQTVAEPFGKLKAVRKARPEGVRGEIVGGNLSVWVSMLGTPFAGRAHGKILFLEDVGEKLYRLDRMVAQLEMAGSLQGARAIILGNFKDCDDASPQGLVRAPKARSAAALRSAVRAPKARDLVALRPLLKPARAIPEIFEEIAERQGIPLYSGVPVGHGPELFSLPLGAEFHLPQDGRLRCLGWTWAK